MEETKTRTFYSAVPGLTLHPNSGKAVMQDGQAVRLGEKIVSFRPLGDGYGIFTTTDPETIEFLERKAREDRDVFEPAEYNRRTAPLADQLRDAQAENERLIAQNNRLLAQLQNEGRLPRTGKA